MKRIYLKINPPIISILFFCALFYAQSSISGSLEETEKSLYLIADFADRMCKDIPLQGHSEHLDLTGEAKAELRGLLKKLADFDIGGELKYQVEEYEGLLQKDLVSALRLSTECKIQIWNDLESKLVPASISAPVTAESPLTPGEWVLAAEETFTGKNSGWKVGSWQDEVNPRFEVRQINGKYRWDLAFSRQSRSGRLYLPYGALVDLDASIDLKFTDSTDLVTATMHIGEARDQIYSFNVSSNGFFSLTKLDPYLKKLESDLISWTPVTLKPGENFDPTAWNRIRVVIEDQNFKLYLNSELQGEYRDVSFSGGKLALSANMYAESSAVIDFDNFELRRKR